MNLLSHEDNKKTKEEDTKCNSKIYYDHRTKGTQYSYIRKVRCVAVARNLITETGAVNQTRLERLLGNHNDAADINSFYQHSSIEDCLTWESCLKPLCGKTVIFG